MKQMVLSVYLHQGQHPLYSLGVLSGCQVRRWKCRKCWAREDCFAHSRYSRNVCLLENAEWSLGRLYSCALTIESSSAMTFALWFLCQQLPTPSSEWSFQAWTPSCVRKHLLFLIACSRYTCRRNHSRAHF